MQFYKFLYVCKNNELSQYNAMLAFVRANPIPVPSWLRLIACHSLSDAQ